jgi:AraC-like DNA-binding protein
VTPARTFFRPPKELREHLRFGLVWPNYGPHRAAGLGRLPSARGTIYFASGIRTHSGRTLEHGLFCEGPRAESFEVTDSCEEMIAFKVRSGALRALLGVRASEVRDRTLDLRDVWGASAVALADRIAGARSSVDRTRALEEALFERLGESADDRATIALADILERSGGRTSLAELVERSGYSRRTFVQKFHDCVGLAPKASARLSRTRAALARIDEADGAIEWAELAVASGYCDQAHMSHEFRDLLGCPPAAFAREIQAFALEEGPTAGRRALPEREQRLYRLLGMVSHWAH